MGEKGNWSCKFQFWNAMCPVHLLETHLSSCTFNSCLFYTVLGFVADAWLVQLNQPRICSPLAVLLKGNKVWTANLGDCRCTVKLLNPPCICSLPGWRSKPYFLSTTQLVLCCRVLRCLSCSRLHSGPGPPETFQTHVAAPARCGLRQSRPCQSQCLVSRTTAPFGRSWWILFSPFLGGISITALFMLNVKHSCQWPPSCSFGTDRFLFSVCSQSGPQGRRTASLNCTSRAAQLSMLTAPIHFG